MKPLLRYFDDIGSFVKPLAFLALVVSFPFLLADHCSRKKEEIQRKAKLAADIQKIGDEYRHKRLLDDLAEAGKEPFGYARIESLTELRVGTQIYQRPKGYLSPKSAGARVDKPRYIGTVSSVSEQGVVVYEEPDKASEALGLTGVPTHSPQYPNTKFIEVSELQRDCLVNGAQRVNLPPSPKAE